MTTQLDLFDEKKVEVERPEPRTKWQVGNRVIQVPLRKRRREAIAQLLDILANLEGKDIYIGTYSAGGQHFWIDNLKLQRLQVEGLCFGGQAGETIPPVIVLWGSRGACVRIFADYLTAVRVQEYQGYWHYLLDFRNGLWAYPIDGYKSHYSCLHITRFKD